MSNKSCFNKRYIDRYVNKNLTYISLQDKDQKKRYYISPHSTQQ